MREPGKPRPSPGWSQLASAGFELAAAVGVFCLIGYGIDQAMGNQRPWALVICAALGIIGGLYNLVRKAVHEAVGIRPPTDRERNRDEQGPST
jgi:F0F1-type ATP synthase assembly protein I